MNKYIKAFFASWCFLFLFSAYLQLNDPDPVLWAGIYLAAAVLCILAFRNIYPQSLLIPSIILCLIGVVYIDPADISGWIHDEWEQGNLTMKTQQMEDNREAFGLLIIAFVLGIASYIGWRKKKKPAH